MMMLYWPISVTTTGLNGGQPRDITVHKYVRKHGRTFSSLTFFHNPIRHLSKTIRERSFSLPTALCAFSGTGCKTIISKITKHYIIRRYKKQMS